MDLHLENRIALVTGPGDGIGAAIASKLVEEGCKVYIADIDLDAARESAERLNTRDMAVRIDVTQAGDIQRNVDAIAASNGTLDILVNNAGILKDGLDRRLDDRGLGRGLPRTSRACTAAARRFCRS